MPDVGSQSYFSQAPDRFSDEGVLLGSKTLLGDELIKSLNSAARCSQAPCWNGFERLEILGEGSYGKIYKVREI